MPAQGDEVDNYLATSRIEGSSFSFPPLRGQWEDREDVYKSYEKIKLKF